MEPSESVFIGNQAAEAVAGIGEPDLNTDFIARGEEKGLGQGNGIIPAVGKGARKRGSQLLAGGGGCSIPGIENADFINQVLIGRPEIDGLEASATRKHRGEAIEKVGGIRAGPAHGGEASQLIVVEALLTGVVRLEAGRGIVADFGAHSG